MRTLSTPFNRGRFPRPRSPLIGREREQAVALTFLRRQDCRLLTLTGPGGIGKTQLALDLAWRVTDDFPDGKVFVALERVTDPDFVLAEIARALGVREASEQDLLEAVCEHIGDRQLLLVLDNFEHVLAAHPVVAELLSWCDQLKVLVTSRVPLHVHGEQQFPVPSLRFPMRDDLRTNQSLDQYPAVALFTQRAQAINPEFVITPHNTSAVAEICNRLDGLPLAIELVAGRLKDLVSPQALVRRLRQDDRLSLHSPGAGHSARQQTMHSAIAWSYTLLSEHDQTLFRRLSVFSGGCTLEAAEAVCQVEDASGGDENEAPALAAQRVELNVEAGMASLVDKSLVKANVGVTGEPRYTMLATIRAYGLEQLVASDESSVIRHAHLAHCIKIAQVAERKVRDNDQIEWLDRVEEEHANFGTALTWALEHGEVEAALRLASLRWFWEVRGYWSEARQWIERALAADTGVPSALRAEALAGAAIFARCQSDYDQAQVRLEEALRLYQHADDQINVSYALNNLGVVARYQGDYDRARELLQQGLAIRQALHNAAPREFLPRRGLGYSHLTLGELELALGNFPEAEAHFAESRQHFEELKDARGRALSLLDLAITALSLDDKRRAKTLYQQSLRHFVKVRENPGIVACLDGLAELAALVGQGAIAIRLFGAATRYRTAGALCPSRAASQRRDEILAEACQRMGEAAYAEEWVKGEALSQTAMLAEVAAFTLPLASQHAAEAQPSPRDDAGLTRRETDVLRLVAAGKEDKEIAEALFIGSSTVRWHLNHVLRKLHVDSRTAAAVWATRHGIA